MSSGRRRPIARRVFDEATIARLNAFRLAGPGRRRSDATGFHAGGGRGGRLEYRDHVPYASGDDFRDIDWSAFARLGELHVKRHSGDPVLEVHVVLDRSASMGIGDGAKDACARRLAAAFVFASVREDVSITVWGIGTGLRQIGETIRGVAGLPGVIEALERESAVSGRLDTPGVGELFVRAGRPRSIVVISDFLDEAVAPARLFRRASAKVHAVFVAVHTDEERSPTSAPTLDLLDIEDGRRLTVDSVPGLLERYRSLFESHLVGLRSQATMHRAPFIEVAAEANFGDVLSDVMRHGVTT